MDARRLALVGIAALVALAGGSVALLTTFGSGLTDRPIPPPAAPGPAGAPAEPAPPSLAQEPAPPPPPPAAPATTPPAIRSMPRALAEVPWEEVPQAARLSDLGPVLAAPVNRALQAARAQLDTCFEEEARILARRQARPDPEVLGPAILVLRLESRQDGLDVADVEVESMGTSTPELVDCARHVLRGWPVPAPGATPARRYRLKWLLQ